MTFAELCELQTRLLYKGKRCFKIKHYDLQNYQSLPEGYFILAVIVHSVDSEDYSNRVIIGSDNLMCYKHVEKLTLGSFTNWIKEVITSLEVHEISELFQLDNERIFHPHKLPVAFKNEKKKKKKEAA